MFKGKHKQIPLDDSTDAHAQIRAMLQGGEFLDDPDVASHLAAEGFTAPWTKDDSLYVVTHAGRSGASIMSDLEKLLVRKKLIGGDGADGGATAPPSYEGQPSRVEMLLLLEEFSVVTATSGNRKKDFAINGAYEKKVTLQNAEEIMGKRGLTRQPEVLDVDPAAQAKFRAYEVALIGWGISATGGSSPEIVEAARALFVKTGDELREMVTVAPGEVVTGANVHGHNSYFLNARRANNRLMEVQDQGVAGAASYAGPSNPFAPYARDAVRSATEAAQKMAALAGVMGIPTRFDGLLSSQVLQQNDWRYYGAQRWDGTRYVPDPDWRPIDYGRAGLNVA